MHATQVPRPFHTKGWVYEEKYDGWRMLAVREAGHVRLVSRNERCGVEARPARCMILFVMADEPSMSGDPAQGYFRNEGKWVRRSTRQAIREALGHDLPVGFNSPTWTQRPLTPGPDWSRHDISPSDSKAVEHVSVSGDVVRFCGACYEYWQEEAATRRR